MIAAAGGVDALAAPGERSRELGWDEIAAARPDVGRRDALRPLRGRGRAPRRGGTPARIGALGAGSAFAVDAAASFSRPGPRLADGVELLGHLLHPDLVPAPAGLDVAIPGRGPARA